jgi:hypothetical protein
LEAKIRQTHNLARLLTKYAEQLLEEYVSRCRDGGGIREEYVRRCRDGGGIYKEM